MFTETGFFLSFTVPKLYSCYTHQISQKGFLKNGLAHFSILQVIVCRGLFVSLKSWLGLNLTWAVERVKTRIGEAWQVCSHKKILAGSAVTAFWNLTSIRTRIFAGNQCLTRVLLFLLDTNIYIYIYITCKNLSCFCSVYHPSDISV